MEKEFVTYEKALALRKLGFYEQCFGGFAKDDKTLYIGYDAEFGEHFFRDFYIPAPLKQQVFRWFREKYEIHGFIIHYSRVMFKWCIDSGDDFEESIKLDTYEEAENACIDKLIELVKQLNKQ